jgi:zinc transport system substrate-binding protein
VGRAALAALGLLALQACGPARPRDERPLVVVSIRPLAWFVDQLAEGGVAVETLIPAGANPHSHEPTLTQTGAISRAVLWVKVGHPSFVFERTAYEALLSERRDLGVVDASGGAVGPEDAHAWLSPRRARGIAARIADGLAARLPSQAPALRERQARLDARIEALDREIAERLRPFQGRAFLVYHPDWSAFAADYGLRLIALERGHKEPDARSLRAAIEEARREGVRAIFVQPQFSKESAELVARELGARVIGIDPLAYEWPATVRGMSLALAEVLAR